MAEQRFFTGQPVRMRWNPPDRTRAWLKGAELGAQMFSQLAPPGTQTLAAKELAEQMRQFDEKMRYLYRELAQKAALARAQPAAGGMKPSEWRWLRGELAAPFYQAKENYLRPVDYLADIKRYSGELINLLGQEEYQELEDYAQQQVANWATGGLMPKTVEWQEVPAIWIPPSDTEEGRYVPDLSKLAHLVEAGRIGQAVLKGRWGGLGQPVFRVPIYKPWGSAWERGMKSPIAEMLIHHYGYPIPPEKRRQKIPLSSLGVMLQPES